MGLFGSSGTRGVVNTEITPAFVERLAAVAATHWDADRVAIGRDPRRASRLFVNAASAGIASTGADVDRLGMLPTPALQGYLTQESCPGVMITASHNPPAYTGVKLFEVNGLEVSGPALDEIEEAFEEQRRRRAHWDGTGAERHVDGVQNTYVDGIVDLVDRKLIERAGLTVAVDPGHGAGSITTPRLCRRLGCRVFTVHDDLDGTFPGRHPEPTPDALDDLSELVQATDADLGIAHDGDADRAMFVDNTGAVIPGDTVLAILATEYCTPDSTVVVAINASDRVREAVRAAGGSIQHTPIGSSNIIDRLQEMQATGVEVPVAGEGNGGIFLPRDRQTRDGALVAARMLELVADSSLEELAGEHAGYQLDRRSIPFSTPEERTRMMARLTDLAHQSEASVDRMDGVRLSFEDGWVLGRPSGTEPVFRLTAEARSIDRVQELLERVETAVTG